MGSLRLDFRYALRLIRKNPAFTAIIVLILALGIGANAAIYSIVDAVLVESFPGHNAHEIVRLYTTEQKGGPETGAFSYPEFREYRENLSSFTGVAAYRFAGLQVTEPSGTTEQLAGELVSGNFFEILGVNPEYGRSFTPSDDGARGSNPVAILSDRYWKRQYDGRPDAIGSILRINSHEFTVIGVLPASLQEFDRGAQIWLPMSMAIEAEPMMATQIDRLTNDFFHVLARLKPGISMQMAQAELDTVSAQLGAGQTLHLWEGMEGEDVSPANTSQTVSANGEMWEWKKPWAGLSLARTGFTQEENRLSWLLLGVAGLVLLVATADVAGLLLARADQEEKEFAIRASLGASNWTLLRQRLVQGFLLASFGAAGRSAHCRLGRKTSFRFSAQRATAAGGHRFLGSELSCSCIRRVYLFADSGGVQSAGGGENQAKGFERKAKATGKRIRIQKRLLAAIRARHQPDCHVRCVGYGRCFTDPNDAECRAHRPGF